MLLRRESLKPPMSQLGQSRQTNTPDEFAAYPLYLQLRLYRWTATNRREVPERDSCTAANALFQITSSASASSVGGISRLSAFAVLILITSSNLLACITGRSEGFSPLRMRPA
jgi:hypothetical protein